MELPFMGQIGLMGMTCGWGARCKGAKTDGEEESLSRIMSPGRLSNFCRSLQVRGNMHVLEYVLLL